MKKNRFLLLIFITFISFFINKNLIVAKTQSVNLSSSGNCSKYFSIRDSSVYGEKSSNLANAGCLSVHQAYEKGKLKSFKYVDESPVCDSKLDEELDKTDLVTTAWYFETPDGKAIDKNASLIIDVYSGSNKVCSDTITGFNTDKKTVKVALKHDKLIQSVTLKGTFKNYNDTVNSEIVLKIVESTSKTKLNTEKGTRKGVVKQDEISTNSDGEIISSSKTSCTDVSSLIHDYWSYVMVIVPILLIVMISIDFFKAMSSSDADAIKKAGANTVKRTVAAVVLLGLPALLGLVFDLLGVPLCI